MESAASENGWNNTHATRTFGTDSDDVFVRDLVGLLANINVSLRDALERKCRGQPFHAMKTFGIDGDDVCVWGLVGLLLVNVRKRFELCVVIYTNTAQFLCEIPRNLPLCGGSERVHSLSEDVHQILCRITASPTKEARCRAKLSWTGHCVRQTTFSRNGNVRRDSDDVTVQENVGLVHVNLRKRFALCVEIQIGVTRFSSLTTRTTPPLCGSSERVLAFSDDLHEILCKITDAEHKLRKWVLCGKGRNQGSSQRPSCVSRRTRTRRSGSLRSWRARGTSRT